MSKGRHEYERKPDFIEQTQQEVDDLYSNVERGQAASFLYHGVPKNMRGDILYPLSQLETLYPDIYAEHVKKYDWRPEVMRERVPFLDCSWNDVIFLSAVHPQRINDALVEAGVASLKGALVYQMDPATIDPSRAVVCLAPHEELSKNNCVPYDPKYLSNYGVIPPGTRDYYRRMAEAGERPLTYHQIPHILYKGTIDTRGLKTVTIR